MLELLLRHEFFSFLYESLTVFFSDVPFSFIFLIVLLIASVLPNDYQWVRRNSPPSPRLVHHHSLLNPLALHPQIHFGWIDDG